MFRKLDGSAFNPSEVEELLKAAGSGGWKKSEVDTPDKTEWESADGARRAMLRSNRHAELARVLSVWTEEWHRIMDEQEKALEKEEESEAKKNLKGF